MEELGIILQKKQGNTEHLLTPKLLLRYAPGSMRIEEDGSRLTPSSAFDLNRLNNINNFETGLSGTLGFDYKTTSNDKEFDFSLAQVLNEAENNKMPDKSSLNEKTSDLVGSANIKLSNNFSLNYFTIKIYIFIHYYNNNIKILLLYIKYSNYINTYIIFEKKLY